MAKDEYREIQPEENMTSSHGPHAPKRSSRRPEDNYPAIERKTGVNRTGPDAPGGPVNIGVKGGAEVAGPDQARKETPQATGRGSRDAPGGLPEE
ncbi:MAG: hypothetical protein K2X74_03305 [Acetobacteraceae bacterium]|nr:hypothetical protein [Acetobacteraceae bacterium]